MAVGGKVTGKTRPERVESMMVPAERRTRALPFREELEQRFRQELASVTAYLGAAESLAAFGAVAAADRDAVAFADPNPRLPLVAHEVAHVLQARRTDGTAPAEADAERIEAEAARGVESLEVHAVAHGVSFKKADAPTGNAFVDAHPQLLDNIVLNLEKTGLLTAIKLGAYIIPSSPSYASMTPTHLFSAMLVDALEASSIEISPLLKAILLPEKLDAIVSKGAAFSAPDKEERDVIDSVGWDLTNALVRRLWESVPRVLPYVATLRKDEKFSDPRPDPTLVPVAHPLDRYVAIALCTREIAIDKAYYDKFAPAPVPLQSTELRTVKVGPAGGPLWHWLVADPADATADEVALAVYGRADFAFRLVALPPRWGFRHGDLDDMKAEVRDNIHAYAAEFHPRPAMLNFADVHSHRDIVYPRVSDRCGTAPKPPVNFYDQPYEPPAPAPIYGLPVGYEDPMVELAQGEITPILEQRDQETAKKKHKPRHDTLELSERLRDIDDSFRRIDEAAQMLGAHSAGLDVVWSAFQYRRALARQGFLGSDIDRLYDLGTTQAKLLGSISYGLADLILQLAGYASSLPLADKKLKTSLIYALPEIVQTPMREAARSYIDAADAIDMPDLARQRLQHAEQLSRDLSVSALELTLRAAGPGNDANLAAGHVGPDAEFLNAYDLYTQVYTDNQKLGIVRVQQIADPISAAEAMKDIQKDVSDVTFKITVLQVAKQLDGYWHAIEEGDSFWNDLSDTIKGEQLKKENRLFYAYFRDTVMGMYRLGDETSQTIARTLFQFMVTMPRFKQHFKDVEQLLKDEASHQRWNKLIAAIAIMVISFGIGAEVGLFAVETLGWSSTAATALGAVADFTVSSLLNYAAFQQTPTLGQAVTQMLSFGTMQAFARVRAVARASGVAEEAEVAIKASLAARAAKATVDFGKEVFLNAAIGAAGQKLQNRIDTGHWVSPEESNEAFVDGAITAVAMTIAQRLHARMMEPRIKNLLVRHGFEIDAVFREREQLYDEVTRLKDSLDRDAALDAIERLNKNLKRELEIMKRMKGLAHMNPKAYKDSLEEIERFAAQTAGDIRETGQASAIIGTEDLGPGLARVDARSIDAVVAQHRSEGGRITKVSTDHLTGLRTIIVQPAKGGPIELREKPAPVAERTKPKVPIETARGFESWLDSLKDPVLAERMRDLYLADPEAAIANAHRDHEYAGPGSEHPIPEDASRARDNARKLDEPMVRELSNRDFSAIERAGYEFDPIKRRFVPKTTRSGIKPDTKLAGRTNEVVGGALPSLAVGHVVLMMLALGDAHVLRVVGIEPPPGFRSEGTEWGLGRRKSDGAIVIVRGEQMGVAWGDMPDIVPLAHSHPYIDSKYFQIGGTREGRVSIADLKAGKAPNELQKIFPSGADFVFAALHGLDTHFVVTPYVLLPDGTIGNPRPGGLETPIVIEIRNSKYAGTEKGTGAVTAEAEVIVRAGDTELMRESMHGGELGNYMPIGFKPPADLVPAVAPGNKPTVTPAPSLVVPEHLAIAANDPRVAAAPMHQDAQGAPISLRNEMLSDPRVQTAVHNEGYDATRFLEAWNDFIKQRPPSQQLDSKTFGEYLQKRNDFRTSTNNDAPVPVTEVIKNWSSMSLAERQRAIVRKAEPALDALLEKPPAGTPDPLPPEIRTAIMKMLTGENRVGKATSWRGARHNVMGAIDKLLISMIKSPAELAQVLELFGSSGRLGTLGEQYVTAKLSLPEYVAGDLAHPSFTPAEVPGLKGVKTFNPDRIVRAARRSLDIKAGYADTYIDLEQAHNYDAFIDASKKSPVMDRVGGKALVGHDYLFLPKGEMDVKKVAEREYSRLAREPLQNEFRVLYLGADGAIYEYRPKGSVKVGATIHEAMGLKSTT